MNHVISKSCYKGTVLQRNYRKMNFFLQRNYREMTIFTKDIIGK